MIYGVYLGKKQDTVLQIHLTSDTDPRTNERTEIVEKILGESLLNVRKQNFSNLKERISYEEFYESIYDCSFVSCLENKNFEDVKSLRLPLFLSLYTEDNMNIFDRIYLTGNLEKNNDGTLRCKEVELVEYKLQKIIEHEKKEKNQQNAAFFYVSKNKIENKQEGIKLIQIEPETTIDDLIIQMKKTGRTENINGIEKKLCKYIGDNESYKLKIENYISGINKPHLFTEFRKTCFEAKISYTYYLQQPFFTDSALEAMVEYIAINKESDSWIAATSNKDKIKLINDVLNETNKKLLPLYDNEQIQHCWNSKKVLENKIQNILLVYKDNIPVISIKQIDDSIFDYEMCNSTHFKQFTKIKKSFIPEIKSAQTEILTFINDPFARMTKRSRFENIFDTVFKKQISFNDFFYSDNKIKKYSSTGYLNKKYGELTFKELLQYGNFLETEFIFYETIDYLFKKRNLDCQNIDYFQEKKEDDFNLQSTDFNIMETITNSSFTKETLTKYLLYSMKGNSHDLSQNEALYKEDKNKYIPVCDDTQKIFSFLSQKEKYEKCIIIPDNSAVEFFADICLAMFLLSTNKFEKIVFKMNARPKFVSDVTKQDYTLLKKFLKEDRHTSILFDSYEKSKRLQFEYKDDYTQIPYVRDFSKNEIKDLKSANLLIVKGDLNFRRFLSDCFCPFDTPLKSLLPKHLQNQKIVFLRMIKSSFVAGLTKTQSDWAHNEIENPEKTTTDKDGLNTFYSSGNYGMISMVGY